MSRKIQTNTVSASGATSLRLLGVVDDALGLVVDELEQDLDRGLEAPRNARGGLARGAPQQEAAERRRAATEKKTESKLTTEKSTRPFGLPVPKWVRW